MTCAWQARLLLVLPAVLTSSACQDWTQPTSAAPPDASRSAHHCDGGRGCVPRARGYPLMAHDPVKDRVYLFGGFYEFGFESEIFDVWAFNPRSRRWKQIADELPPTNGDQVALDSQSRKVIMFQPYLDPIQTWAFDLETETWEDRRPAVQPPPRWGSKMVYDRESDRVILYGGAHLYTEALLGDTWAYDFDTNTWTELTPPSSPPRYHFVEMVYVPTIDRVLMFGGIAERWDSGVLHNETWAYDYNANRWTNLGAGNAPSPRVYHTMAFEAATNRVVMFGGVQDESNWPNEPVIGETWIYHVKRNAWHQVHPRRAPSPRSWHGMTGTNRTVMLFGGGDSRWTYTNDTFLYTSRPNTWTGIRGGGRED
jgi:hypothetical protein